MRISDWSSDVCSSDLRSEPAHQGSLHRADPARTPDGARGGPVAPRARAGPATGSWHEPMRVTESHLRKWSLLQVSNGSCAVGMAMAGLVLRSEEHTSELQSLMRKPYAVFCLEKKK